MIKKLYITFLFLISFTIVSQAQLKTPALSPSSEIKQTIGLTEIEIKYSRPSAKGRTIFGKEGLIMYDNFWRTGANAATKITFSDDITVGGEAFEKGSYAILTKPGKESWAVYFYPYESGNWSSYVELKPAAMINAKVTNVSDAIETFTMSIDDIAMDNANLVLGWGKKKVVVPIEVEVKKKVMENIEKTMAGPSGNDYFQAALFMHETGTDLEKALTYIQKVTKGNNARFFQVYREAAILADLNRKNEAIEAAKKSLELSKEAGNNDFVRLNEKLIAKLTQ